MFAAATPVSLLLGTLSSLCSLHPFLSSSHRLENNLKQLYEYQHYLFDLNSASVISFEEWYMGDLRYLLNIPLTAACTLFSLFGIPSPSRNPAPPAPRPESLGFISYTVVR